MPKTVGALRGNTNLSKKKASTDYGIFIESLPKIFSEVCGEETETPTITHEQYLSIMELLGKKDNPAILPIQIAYYTGLRLGEACGLAWQDISLEEQYLTVRRSLRYNSTRHKLELGTTKRRKIRTVDFGDTLTEILKQARRKQHRERFRYGDLYHHNYYRHDGMCESPATVASVCRKIQRELPGMEDFHFHMLRHTYTSNLLCGEASPKDVQELLGHSDVSTTMNVYAHATREAKRTSARLLDKVVGGN